MSHAVFRPGSATRFPPMPTTPIDSSPSMASPNRRSHDHAKGLGALYIVSAWATERGIALGQVATDAKSNEITAIPQLLGQIDLKGALISIDAMGCQRAIVKQIVAGGGDFAIAV